MKKIALVAGQGELPLILAEEARRDGAYVVGIALNGITDKELGSRVDKIYWGDITETKRALDVFRSEKIEFIVMTGKIPKSIIFNKDLKFDKDASELFKNNVDSKDYTIIKAIAGRLRREGMRIMDPTIYLSKLIPKKGLIAGREPSKQEWADIKFGRKTAKVISGMDIGQAVMIRKKMVIAVEAHEGTDNMIRRASTLDSEGAVVVKVSRPRQDMRFDVPTIGPETIDSLIFSKAKALAVEAGRTLVVDSGRIVKKADAAGIAVVAI
jgi:DUF1009 family protein